jgi:hypothetical protein
MTGNRPVWKGEVMVNTRRRVRLRHICLVGAILVAITPLVAGHLGRPAIGASTVVPGSGLADIALGQPIAEVLNRFGTPTAVRLTGTEGLLGYGFDKYGITVYAHGDVVQAVATTNSVISGVNGVSLGAPLADVVKAMGSNYSRATIEGFPGIVYREAGIAFGLDRDSVASILVFRPVVAAPAPAAPTGQSGAFVNPPNAPAGETAAPAPESNETAVANPTTSPVVFDVSQMRSFTAASHYLSLNGYLRLLMRRSSNMWTSGPEPDLLLRQP